MASDNRVGSGIFVTSISAATAFNDGIAFLGITACAEGCQRLAGLDGIALGARDRDCGSGGGGGGGKESGGGGCGGKGGCQLSASEAMFMLLKQL